MRAYDWLLRELHWLPIPRQITFKTAVLAYTVRLRNTSHTVSRVNVHWPLSLAFLHRRDMQVVVPRMRTKYGDRSFAVQGPRISNSLSVDLQAPDKIQTENICSEPRNWFSAIVAPFFSCVPTCELPFPFLSYFFLSSPTAKTDGCISSISTSNDAFSAKDKFNI